MTYDALLTIYSVIVGVIGGLAIGVLGGEVLLLVEERRAKQYGDRRKHD